MIAFHQRKTLLPSAPRAAAGAVNTAPQGNQYARGLALYLDVTAVAATPNISAVAVQASFPGGLWRTIASWTGLSISGVSQNAFLLYPGAASAGGWTAAPVQGVLPSQYRVAVTHDDADSITYSLEAEELV